MSERVPARFPFFSASPTKIGVIGSSSGLALPMVSAGNFLAGYKMNSLIYWNCFGAYDGEGISGEARVYTTRYPNCDAVGMICGIREVSSNPIIQLTAGGGSTAEFVPQSITPMFNLSTMYAEWDSGDSGDQEIIINVSNCKVDYIVLWNLQRDELDSGDDYIQRFDETYPQAGLTEGRYIIDGSSNAKLEDIASTIKSAKDNNKPQGMSWTYPGMDEVVNAGSWTETTYSPVFSFQAKQYKSEVTRSYRVYVYSEFDGTPGPDDYDWRLRSTVSGYTASQTGLVNTSSAWSSDTIDINASANDLLVFEVQTNLGTDDVHIRSVCVYED